MGSSLGGLFALYAMFTDPKLFSGYVAASPAVTYANRGAFATEAAYAREHTELPAKLFVAVGDQEPLAAPVRELIDTCGDVTIAGSRSRAGSSRVNGIRGTSPRRSTAGYASCFALRECLRCRTSAF